MRAVVQRVTSSSVKVDGEVIGSIKKGFNVLLGICKDDTVEDLKYIKEKIINLRVFQDENEKMNLSIIDVRGEILAISQFTLYADCKKGNRPSFTNAGKPDLATVLYDQFNQKLQDQGMHVEKGIFGADMKIELLNDGPVTIILDSNNI